MSYLYIRDLAERLAELSRLRDALNEAREERNRIGSLPNSTQDEIDKAREALQDAELDFGEPELEELENLESLRNEIGSEWKYGVTLIPEDEFENYARQFAEDIGAIDGESRWPATCIDWEAAANELKMDFSSVTYEGREYLYRS